MKLLKIKEIYGAILGESRLAGWPCTIVRLSGCHRRCVYCDTEYAFRGGEEMSVAAILAQVSARRWRTVLVTGGEPLLQSEVVDLLAALIEADRQVVLETSGTIGATPLAQVPSGVMRVVDVKTPGSGLTPDVIDWEGLGGLGPADEIKIVCCHRDDYEWARDEVIGAGRLPDAVPVSISPVHGELAAHELAEWLLADGLELRFQIQLHRAVWPDRDRGV